MRVLTRIELFSIYSYYSSLGTYRTLLRRIFLYAEYAYWLYLYVIELTLEVLWFLFDFQIRI